MKTYSTKEVAKKIKVPPGTIRQWEKDFNGFLAVPRSKQGARIYTEIEIDLLIQIKQMLADKIELEFIKDWLKSKTEQENTAESSPTTVIETEAVVVPKNLFDTKSDITAENDEGTEPEDVEKTVGNTIVGGLFPELSLTLVKENSTAINEGPDITNANQFFEAMDTYKENFLSEVKSEIKNVLRKEVMEEVKREITKGTLCTVKSISDSIYKSGENTKTEIQGLAETLEKTAEHTTESLQYLSNRITNVSIESSEEIFSLSKQLAENTEELARYVDITNNEIYNLTETLTRDREYLEAEREQYLHEIKQRESAFQEMLSSFRDAAAVREKKWWKFWSN